MKMKLKLSVSHPIQLKFDNLTVRICIDEMIVLSETGYVLIHSSLFNSNFLYLGSACIK